MAELRFRRVAKNRIYPVDLYPSSGWKTVAEALPLPCGGWEGADENGRCGGCFVGQPAVTRQPRHMVSLLSRHKFDTW